MSCTTLKLYCFFQSCGSIICGVTAITLKSTIGWHGIFFMAAGISALRKY